VPESDATRDVRPETRPSASPASYGLRSAALLLDAMLAASAAVVLRLGVQLGLLPGFGSWSAGLELPWVDPQLVLLTLALLAVRDLPTGASLAKWLLCLRVAGRDGRPLGLGLRLLRAPVSLLPLALLPAEVQHRLPWRVVGYAPGVRGLVLRTLLTGGAAAVSIAWAVETVRPSIGRDEAARLARTLVDGDPLLGRALGEPLEHEVLRVTPRAHQAGRGQRASFEMRVRGLHKQQSMTVHVRRVDGAWTVEEVLDIDIGAVTPDGRGPVAAR
jgi:hypothetical protein